MRVPESEWVGELFELAKTHNLDCETTIHYINFYLSRFPGSRSLDYAEEWADRFNKGPMSYMDAESKAIYRFILDQMNQGLKLALLNANKKKVHG